MNKKQEHQLRVAKTRFSQGDIFAAFNALMKAGWYGVQRNDYTKVKAPKEYTKPATTVVTPDDIVKPETKPNKNSWTKQQQLKASIYDWGTKPTLANIPFGFVGTDVITVDFTQGDILIVNDLLRKNINTLLAGITRTDNVFLVGANDPLNSLHKWEKHFAYIAKTPDDTSATIASIYFLLQARMKGTGNNDTAVFLYINNLHSLTGIDAQRVKSILDAPKSFNVNVIANVSKAQYETVKQMFNNSFEYEILFSFEKTTINSSWYSGDLNTYVIPTEEIDAFEINSNNYFDAKPLNLAHYKLYNLIVEMNATTETVPVSLANYLVNSGDYFTDLELLSFDDTEKFMKLVINDNRFAAAVYDIVPDFGDLMLIADKKLEAGKPVPTVPVVKVNDVKVDMTPVEPVRPYTKTELDQIFVETVKQGFWGTVAKSSKITLTDEQLNNLANLLGVKTEQPTQKETVNNTTSEVTEPTTPDTAENTGADIELDEQTIRTYMLTTGESREATIKFLKENLRK